MEPCIAALVIFSHVPLPDLSPAAAAALSLLAPVQALWTGVASIRSSAESIQTAAPQRAMLESARARLGASPAQIVLGAEAGLEYLLNRRLVQQPVYLTALSRVGRYPLDVWQRDLTRPEVVGLLMNDDLLERPLSEENVSDDLFAPPVRSFVREHYALVATGAGLYLYARTDLATR
jgi:hypothetical protein